MTDPTAEPAVKPAEPFAIVPTLDWALELERRVKALELTPDVAPTSPFDAADYVRRLDRHREELERLKTWCNDLGRYLDNALATTTPAPTVTETPEDSPL